MLDMSILVDESFDDYELLKKTLDQYKLNSIITTNEKHINELINKYINNTEIKLITISSDFDNYGKSAIFNRNVRIIDLGKILFVFWKGNDLNISTAIQHAKKEIKLGKLLTY